MMDVGLVHIAKDTTVEVQEKELFLDDPDRKQK